jgi:hypothetical protein
MNSRCRTLALIAALAMSVQANAQQIIKFDAPNSGTGTGQGTAPTGINNVGVITGSVTDNSNGTHGFVGNPHGGFTNFDAPGANPVVGCTCPSGINDLGVIAGFYIDTNSVYHGFVRGPDGQITAFDDSQAPAGTGANQGTVPQAINDIGETAGYYTDGNGASHGFVRTAGGKITTFDAPGALDGTYPENINNFGVIAGVFYDANGVAHGFVRSAVGHITTFDPPNSFTGPTSFGTYDAFINDLGLIAGSYFDASTYVAYGYTRWPDGQFTEFAAPGAGTVVSSSDESGTYVFAAPNLEGAVTGLILDDNFESHSFVRAANGEATTFNIPGQAHILDNNAGSVGLGINMWGVIVGRWRDPNLTFHGYLRTP